MSDLGKVVLCDFVASKMSHMFRNVMVGSTSYEYAYSVHRNLIHEPIVGLSNQIQNAVRDDITTLEVNDIENVVNEGLLKKWSHSVFA
jgi:hypothetical protein